MQRLGQRLADQARVGDVILLIGDLGSGKTTLARYIIQALGIEEDIPSPTFTLLQSYDGQRGDTLIPIFHFDLYRLEAAGDIYELGLEDALDTGLSLIEWPDIAAPALPDDRLEIHLEAGSDADTRAITITGSPSWVDRLQLETGP